MLWPKLIIACFQFMTALMRSVEHARIKKQGIDEAINAGLQAAIKGLKDAQIARDTVQQHIDAKPDELLADDGFRRKK